MSKTVGDVGGVIVGVAAKPGGPKVSVWIADSGEGPGAYLTMQEALKLCDLLTLAAANLDACHLCGAFRGNPHGFVNGEPCPMAPR